MKVNKLDNRDPSVVGYIGYILATILLKVNDQGELRFHEDETLDIFGTDTDLCLVMNYLKHLSSQDILHFESYYEFGGSGLAGMHYTIKINSRTRDYFLGNIFPSIPQQIENLKAERELLLTFDPDKLSNEITETKNGIQDIENQVATNKVLSSLNNPLKELLDYVNRIERVTNIYSDIFLHIIKPIQRESKAGIRATAIWAIISILITMIISLIIINW